MPVSSTDLKFFLTGLEPGVAQVSPTLSLGGYVTTTPISASALLSSLMTTDASVIALSSVLNGRLLIDGELLDATSGAITARGALTTSARPHPASTPAYQTGSSIFDDAFDETLSQYRCIAAVNSNTTSSFKNLRFYFKANSRNPDVQVSMALEAPSTIAIATTATSGSTILVRASSLIGTYPDNYFTGCSLTMTSGGNIGVVGIVASYDNATGTFVLTTAMPLASSAGDTFAVSPAPSQEIGSGTISPITGGGVSVFQSPTDVGSAISIDVNGYRSAQRSLYPNGLVGTDLGPNEVIYLWLKRTATANAEAFANNRVILTASYTTT